jgi:type II secretory pathway component PulJ
MSRAHADESGFTLIEVLIVSVLMVMVLGAVLTTFNSFQSNAETNARQNDAQDEARHGIDMLARDVRNLASPTIEQPQAVKRADPQDLIVQSVAPVRPAGSLNPRNTRYVRYCYAPGQSKVYRQRLTWTTSAVPSYPAATACPGSGWQTTEALSQHVVNGTRALFTYNSATLTDVTEISTTLWVDVNPGRRPKESTIQTTVFLRNQNRAPIARFSAAPSAGGILLNGSESEDPEERALRYFWYDAAVGTVPRGEGIVFQYTPPAPGPRTVYLIVKDPADLANQAPNQTVCVPGQGVTC